MAEKRRLQNLTDGIEGAVASIICLTLIVELFSPWEYYVNHLDFSLSAAPPPKGMGVSGTVVLVEYLSILALTIKHLNGVLKSLWLAWPILVLCGWILMSISWAAVPLSSLNHAGRFMFTILFSGYVAFRYGSLQFVGFLTRVFAVTMLASLAVMVLVPNLGYSGLGGGNESAWRGALVHKNSLGAAMSFGIIVSGYSFIARANYRVLSAITFLGCLLLLVMSRSATAMVSTVVAVIVAITGGAVQSQERAPVLRAFAFGGLGIVIVLLIIWPLVDFDLTRLSRSIGRSATLSGRTDVWRAVWMAIRQRPVIGYGYAFWEQPSVMRTNIWRYVNWAPPHAHNNWLDAGLQLGLVGAGITAIVWLMAFTRAIWLVLTQYGHGALFYLTILFICLSQSAVETVTFSPGLGSLFWWTTSCIYIARIAHNRVAASNSLTNGRPRLIGAQSVRNGAVSDARS